MVFNDKKGKGRKTEQDKLYPLLHVAASIQDYRKKIVEKEVSSLKRYRNASARYKALLILFRCPCRKSRRV